MSATKAVGDKGDSGSGTARNPAIQAVGRGRVPGCAPEDESPITWGAFRDALNRWAQDNGSKKPVLFDVPYWSLLWRPLHAVPYAYVCWGTPKRGAPARWARILKLRCILRTAKVIIVHDVLTHRWIRRFARHDSVLLPLPVDTSFFRPGSQLNDAPYVLVPGDNDRNEDYVIELARHVPTVVRVCQDPRTLARFNTSGAPANIVLEYRVPWLRLRELYRGAAAVVLPTGRTTHAAGQQAMLESIACAKPVFTDSPHLLSIGRRWGLPVHHLPRSPGHLAELLLRRSVVTTRDGLGGLPRDFAIDAALERYLDVLALGEDRQRQ